MLFAHKLLLTGTCNIEVSVVRQNQPKGTIINTQFLYTGIYKQFPRECEKLGFTNSAPIEPKWKKDIRWGLQDAKTQSLIKHVGLPKSSEWQRL